MQYPGTIGQDEWPGLIKLVEEMSELTQVLSKIIAVDGNLEYWGINLKPGLLEESADVLAAFLFFLDKNISLEEKNVIADRAAQKMELFAAWQSGNHEARFSDFNE